MSFVTFPGAAGNYASTPDVNLLDADTAHGYQSVGYWTDGPSIWTAVGRFDDATCFGGTYRRWTAVADNPAYLRMPVGGSSGLNYPPAPAGDVMRAAIRVRGPAGRSIQLAYHYFDGSGTRLGQGVIASAEPTTGDWQVITNTFTAPAGAASVSLEIFTNNFGWLEDEPLDLDWAFVYNTAETSETAFVPSLRIVGILTEQFDATPDDPPVVFLGDGTPLKIGDGWAGNLTSYIRRDGDATAPIVAQFDAADVGGVL